MLKIGGRRIPDPSEMLPCAALILNTDAYIKLNVMHGGARWGRRLLFLVCLPARMCIMGTRDPGGWRSSTSGFLLYGGSNKCAPLFNSVPIVDYMHAFY